MELKKPHNIAVQPYSRTPQFYTLAEWRMKDILVNHYQTIEKYSEKLLIETVYCLGMGSSDYLQIVRFNPEDIFLFHKFVNEITKINSPFMDFKEPVIGIAKVEDYWLAQFEDIDLKKIPMSEFSRSRWGIKT